MQPDWDKQYAIQETPWDKGAAAPPLVDWLTANPGRLGGRVMVPGCGLGHDMRAIVAADPEAEVVGLDISPLAVEAARAIPPAGKERYREGNLFDLPEGMLEAFDWIFEHTCYCAIDPVLRDDYVSAVWTALRPGGRILALFYLDPYDDEHAPGGGPPHGCTVEELEQRFEQSGRFRFETREVPKRAFEGREDREYLVEMTRLD